jgi:hypothetical protein
LARAWLRRFPPFENSGVRGVDGGKGAGIQSQWLVSAHAAASARRIEVARRTGEPWGRCPYHPYGCGAVEHIVKCVS